VIGRLVDNKKDLVVGDVVQDLITEADDRTLRTRLHSREWVINAVVDRLRKGISKRALCHTSLKDVAGLLQGRHHPKEFYDGIY